MNFRKNFWIAIHRCRTCSTFIDGFTGVIPHQRNRRRKPGWMEWGEKYCPHKPVRGGVMRAAWPLYIGLMNPNHMPVLDWVTMSYMYEKLILLDAATGPRSPGWPSPGSISTMSPWS